MRKKYMQFTTTITGEQVENFCKSTADENPIHNQQHMRELGKEIVVPGLYIFSLIVNFLQKNESLNFNTFRIFFGNIVGINEAIDLGFERSPISESQRYLYARTGADCFSLDNSRSFADIRSNGIGMEERGRHVPITYNKEQVHIFRKLLGLSNAALLSFLFSVSLASPMLISTIRKPVTDVDKEIAMLFNKSVYPEGISPLYQSLEIFRLENSTILEPEGQVDYWVQLEKEKAGKFYAANVSCGQSGKVMYNSRYRLVAVPNKVMLRMVRELKNQGSKKVEEAKTLNSGRTLA
ncbi:MAG TPA: hypothetical protein PLY31_08045 [Tenuifilaceae bacterium]|nr:hypothetical protein [Tenuifilaceae bacterium]